MEALGVREVCIITGRSATSRSRERIQIDVHGERSSWWSFGAGTLTVVAGIIALVHSMLAACGGEWVYPLDDSYIHMAVARNLQAHGTWGVTPDAFSSSSSSPAWVVLVAGLFRAFGASEWVPLLANGVLAVGVVGIFSWWASRPSPPGAAQVPGWGRVAAVVVAIGLAPLPALVVQGMEHVFQILTTSGLLLGGAILLSGHRRIAWVAGVAVFAALAPMVRYEALVVVASLAGLLVLQRRMLEAVILGLAGLGPVAVYASVAMWKGWYALPVGVLLASTPSWTGVSVPERLLANLSAPVNLVPLGVLALLSLGWFERDEDRQAARIYLGTAVLHLLFGRVGDAYRYDAYLVAIGILVAARGVIGGLQRVSGRVRKGQGAALAMAVVVLGLVAAPLVSRAATILSKSAAASADVQAFVLGPAQLAADVLRPRTVAITWLGYMAWIGDDRDAPVPTSAGVAHGPLRFLDLDGFASRATAGLFLGPTRDRVPRGQAEGSPSVGGPRDAELAAILEREQVQAAIIGDSWFRSHGFSGPPPGWRLAGAWMVTGQYGGWTLTHLIWATHEADAVWLRDELRALVALPGRLPERVVLVVEEGREVQASNLTGAAVQHEPRRVAFYTNGRAQYTMPADGELIVTVSGDEAGEGAAHIQIHGVAGSPVVDVGSRPRRLELGPVRGGDTVTLTYGDDLVDEAGRDRNVYVWSVRVVGPR